MPGNRDKYDSRDGEVQGDWTVMDQDHITHFFLFCPKEKQFWNTFFTWWNNLGDIQIPTQCECLEENILFGFQIEEDILTVLNICS